MESRWNDADRLLDVLKELRLYLESSLPIGAQREAGCGSAPYSRSPLLDNSLNILSELFLMERLRCRWRRYRNHYQRRRNALLLLTLGGVIRPANVELTWDAGRQNAPSASECRA
jgi:hypothetical protein